ncbi:hypothetical protein HHK36_009892 [Tetracentron sinense]|uniref:DDE Tnp4 domain-containing protein n=1 Tax=Tetracentron sinense TaxID=13715 RepID=A0A834ZDI1_TETSI|nr:hypothetical protein HHK36_009892 [Tetracentron sinense]
MDSRALAALVSSLVSEVLLVLLLFPSPDILHSSSSPSTLLPLILHLLSSSEIASSISLLISPSRKGKRILQSPDHETDEDDEQEITDSNDRVPPFPNPDSFKVCFRMTSTTFEWLSGLLEPLLECRDPVGSPLNLPPEIRLGIGLFRLATGSGYSDLSRRFGVSESITRFCTKQLCRVLCTNFRFWVAFPSPIELESVSAAFEAISGFPNCCGVIDCTRFKIVRGGNYNSSNTCKFKEGLQEESIVAQIVVDSSSRILSIVAGFRGDKGDSRVLRSSNLYKDVDGGGLLNGPLLDVEGVGIPQYLVGDGGYPLLPWLMVPFIDPVPASCEEDFNAAQHLMRLPGLRTIASLRNWGVLNRPIEEEFKTAVACIGACSILHNVLLMREDHSALSDGFEDYSLHDQSSQYYRESSLEENSIERKASLIQNALAARVREVRNFKLSSMSDGSRYFKLKTSQGMSCIFKLVYRLQLPNLWDYFCDQIKKCSVFVVPRPIFDSYQIHYPALQESREE